MRQFIQIVESALKANHLYHATPTKNVSNILRNGLAPGEGAEDSSYYGEEERTYFFPSFEETENALYSWLGDRYMVPMTILRVDMTDIPTISAHGELYTTEHIDPDRIEIIPGE